MIAFTFSQAHVTYVTHKLALNIQVNVSNKPCLGFMYFIQQGFFFYFKYSFNKCIELKLLYVLPYDTEVILSICIAVVDYTCINSVRKFRKFIRLE